MIVFPAIDLKDGKVVRLLQGRMEDATVYSDNPVEVAKGFVEEGAEYLHVVDLNGAFEGQPVNDKIIGEIVKNVSLKVQVGGGIRTLSRIEELLEIGVERVILGTIAVRDPELVKDAVQRFGGEHIIVGIDAKDGMVAVQGWAEKTNVLAVELGKKMQQIGVKRTIYTDIARDGMLKGPNIESTVKMAKETGLRVIASGGISSLDDLKRVKEEATSGVAIDGAITGKALYAGAFTLKQAIDVMHK
ncbi:MAG: 1-(5-phosphoribosyl)-5-[(5-phosphoribosylamino)methylideneamino]imidazole-4-carboxamide isomerase [Eubacteriales bacterium]